MTFLAATLVAAPGCARMSRVKARVFDKDDTVAPIELGEAPAVAKVERSTSTRSPSPRTLEVPRQQLATPTWQTIGESIEGRPIEIKQFGSGSDRVLIIGGIHGDEPEGLPLIDQLAEDLAAQPAIVRSVTVVLLRNLNPDGTEARTRGNKSGVDLNRNFPANNWESTARQPRFKPGPRPASEPETKVLVDLLREFQPSRILVMHSTRGKPMNNYDGPARELAELLSGLNGYVVSETIGYPTPGSLGSYAGIDMSIPIITLELPHGVDTATASRANGEALRRFVQGR